MSRLIGKPKNQIDLSVLSKYARFYLSENPFPAHPYVNQESTDKRTNGFVYEMEIRKNEYDRIKDNFLQAPQVDANHPRLGYIVDTSYVGRGNGKSAFLLNLQQNINRAYCIDISNEINKCFAVYVSPRPSGQTKSFYNVVDLIFQAIIRTNVIDDTLAILRYDALSRISPEALSRIEDEDEDSIVSKLSTEEWFKDNSVDYADVAHQIKENESIKKLDPDFPLNIETAWIGSRIATKNDFHEYYERLRPQERLNFLFTEMIYFFTAAGFNGAYVLVDDFERIPNFQTARQKTDFATELRSALFDGFTLNAITGFFNIILVLHAGVHRLISEAWAESGMGNRSPIELTTEAYHVIPFEKLTQGHALLLLKKYLSEYRTVPEYSDSLIPFTERAIYRIGELSEYNAARMLKMAHDLLERISVIAEQEMIDEAFVEASRDKLALDSNRAIPEIGEVASEDLIKKAQAGEW